MEGEKEYSELPFIVNDVIELANYIHQHLFYCM